MSKRDFDSMVYALGVLLADETQGIINNTLKKNFDEEYQDFDLMTAWECFVEEVNRIDAVLDLHDILIDMDEKCKGQINKRISEDNE